MLSRVLRNGRVGCRNTSVVNPKDLRIPVWVSVGADLRGTEHNIAVSASVDCITIMPDVICGVVHHKSFDRINEIVDDSD